MKAVVFIHLIMEIIKVKYSKHMSKYLGHDRIQMVCAFILGSLELTLDLKPNV